MINCLLNLYRFPPSCTIQVRHNRSQFLSSLSFAFHESARRILSIEKKARRFHSIRRRDFMTFFCLLFSSSHLLHRITKHKTVQGNSTIFYFIFWLNVRLFSARLWVHEKVLQTSFQLLHVSEETRVFARRNMWMVANGTRRNWKFSWTITAHTTPGHWRTRTLALTWIPAFFYFSVFHFSRSFRLLFFFHFTKD